MHYLVTILNHHYKQCQIKTVIASIKEHRNHKNVLRQSFGIVISKHKTNMASNKIVTVHVERSTVFQKCLLQ